MMKQRLPLFMSVAAALVAALVWIWFNPKVQTATGFAMGSVFNATLWVTGLPYPGLSDDFTQLVQDTEAGLADLEAPPREAERVRQASGGAFTLYLGALVQLWNINQEPYVPTQDEIESALRKNELDLGAYGKGAACDAMLRQISHMTVKAAVINLGGNILTAGRKPWGKPFKIALRDPKRGPNDTLGTFILRGTWFISTSGSYEKYFERDGKRYHHIFDPQTGYPAQRDPGLISVTVLTRQDRHEAAGALGDMISTACFVLGYEASQDLLEQYGCDALFIYEDGTVKNAGSAWDFFQLTDPSYHWDD